MFIGEGPGEQEDRQGLPFVGRSGQLLDRLLREELGITRDRVYIANVVKCRPPGNRDPKPDEIDACRPYLQQQLDLIRPAVVVTLGRFAAQWLLETTEGITRLRGRSYPFAHGVLIPTLHPAAALRGGRRAARADASRLRAGQAGAGRRGRGAVITAAHHVGRRDQGRGGRAGLAWPAPGDLIAAGRRDGGRARPPSPRASRPASACWIRSPARPSPSSTPTRAACGSTTPTSTGWSALAEVADLALGELLDDDDAVVLVEWGDVVSTALGAELMTVRLEPVGTDEPDLRLVSVTATGDGWTARWPRVQSALAAWVAG